MPLTADNRTIECKTSDSQWPPGQTQGKQCTGLASWLKINGRWHRWEGTGSQLVEALELAEVSALAEWIECYADDLVEFQVENCPSCGHEDFHFGGGVWVCDCCGHSW